MESVLEAIDPFLVWIQDNIFWSSMIAISATTIGIYFKTLIQSFAKKHFEQLTCKPPIVEDVFDEPDSALISNRTDETYQCLTAEKLIEFYEVKEQPYRVSIGSKAWIFASTREVDPIGFGAIDDQNIEFHYQEEWFELDHELAWLTSERLDALNAASKSEKLFNGDPFRIKSTFNKKNKIRIELGRAKYFDSLRTSYSLDFILPKCDQSLREILHEKTHSFGTFDKSRLPNHMGLVVIIETTDGQLVIQKRSQNVQIRPGTLSASVSGTFEKGDLDKRSGVFSLSQALEGVVREMHGELGGKYSSELKNLYFMGLMREFRRGGFPDFYFYYESPLSFEELKANSLEAEETFEIDSIEGAYIGSKTFISNYLEEKDAFDKRVNNLLERIEGAANLTLSLGIGLYYEMIYRRATPPQPHQSSAATGP